jgi:alcohol dehydrogenase YqhD (iron-dependent ADH family)
MENFVAYNPTKLYFGKSCVDKLGKEATQYGQKALVLIGKGSIKKNGILDKVLSQLKNAGIDSTVYEGIKSNPIYQDADAAVAQGKAFGAKMVIAVGGGSVLDTAKAVAAGLYVAHSVWDFYTRKAQAPTQAAPLITVLTLAATGSEMNMFTVLQNDETGVKSGYGHPLLFPKASFLDPEYTYSVPLDYTAYGVADLISHVMELYFEPSDSPLSHYYSSDIIQLAIQYGRAVMNNPTDYDIRANIMWLATNALNGSLAAGKRGGDWGVHGFEHSLSVLFDIPHGAGLSIVYPAWLKSYQPDISTKLDFLAQRLLGPDAKGVDYINMLEKFYRDDLGIPTRLSEANIGTDKHALILENLRQNRVSGGFFQMDEARHQDLLNRMA